MSKRSNGEGHIRQRKDGRWEAQVAVGTNPGTGKPIRKSIYADTQAEVVKKLREVCKAIDEGVYIEPSKMTVSQWFDIWLTEYTGNVKEHTHVCHETHCRVHIKPALGAIALSALRPHNIQNLYNRLAKGDKDRSSRSPKTIKNLHGVVHRALDQAVILGYLKQNPCQGVILPRVERANIKPLMDEQIGMFEAAIKGHEYEHIFTVTMYTGMRQAEVMGLTWDCVDIKNGTIYIDKQLLHEKKKGGKFKFAPPKNNKPRTIIPIPSVMRLIEMIRLQQKEDQLKAGELWDNHMNLVFTNGIGGHFVHNTLSANFKRVVVSIGLPDRRFHDLRHTYAVLALQSGVDIKTVQEALGHHTAAFILDQYGHVTERMQKDAAIRMEAYIHGMRDSK